MRIKSILREYLKNILPFEWLYGRKHKAIIASHKRVADYWDRAIETYQRGEIPKHTYTPKRNLGTEKVIWQYWGQGLESDKLPKIVQLCFASVDKHAGDYKVIRLTDSTLSDYLNLPPSVLNKVKTGKMRKVFLSDLLRTMLLATYGGIWLDATILMTGPFPNKYMRGDHFCFQRDPAERYQSAWEKAFIYYYSWRKNFQVNFLSSILWAKKGSEMMTTLTDFLLYFWENDNTPKEYFFFQILYNRLINGTLHNIKPAISSDCTPHILHALVSGLHLPYTYSDAFALSSLHKLTYFDNATMRKLKKVLETYTND